MKDFLKDNGVLAVELEDLQKRAAEELGWSYSYWQNRYVGRTPMDATDRKALGAILSEMRQEQRLFMFYRRKNEYEVIKAVP